MLVQRSAVVRGHTLPELIATLGVAAVLATVAVPSFSNLLLDSRMSAALTTAMHAVNRARQFSAARGQTIRLCGSDNGRLCSERADWTGSLLLTDETAEFQHSLALDGGDGAPRIRSNRPIVRFEGGSGFVSPATFTICDRRGARAARAVIVSRSGRPRESARDASGGPLAC